ncbi:peroxisomal membrane anchor protein conserved region-domain-containing protein [Papiliotrema laurentii]|uniref:Peroxisomal membrane protein PEX14 n=1 Tax=Papiliotrema laurentii TaxID=5418 RepID=A0AAD9CYW3_PAPLA|nr:peroxisomal membrane anchor protein conserved region-domain-containing protein [Papiliotrema laurentii]
MASSSGSREELLHNAVLFLLDPKVKESSLTSRITFLEGKGLTEPEIQEALKRAAAGETGVKNPSPGGWEGRSYPSARLGRDVAYGTGGPTGPPAFPQRDWRDVFIMAVISGGVVYGLTALARKYLVPHLRPPTTSSFQQTSQSLSEQYDAAQASLDELTRSTKSLQDTLEADRERITTVVEEVEGAVRSVKDNEERWREEMREVRGEVESVRDLVPKMIEKHSAAQSASLKDLQNELRSLKALLQSRAAQPQPQPQPLPTASSSPPTKSADSLASSTGSLGAQSSSTTSGPPVSATTAAANALLAPKGARGIPAWQKAPSTPSRSETTTPVEGKGKGKEVDREEEASASGST